MEEEKMNLLRKCFNAWKRFINRRKQEKEAIQTKLAQREKLDQLVKALKKYKKEKRAEEEEAKKEVKVTEPVNNFKNRFQAQKSTIERLTLKLEEKDRLIEELKLGVFDREALKSLNETKIEIREIFANCSAKVRCKVAPPPDYSEKFMIMTQKAPKIVQEMEEKAVERAKRREIILERKRIIQENKQRMVAEAIERKRVQDEEEKKRNLERIKEKRRKELEKEKTRQANKAIFLEKLKRAIDFYNKNLLKKAFQAFCINYKKNKENYKKSVLHHKINLLRSIFEVWKKIVEDKYQDKNALADTTFAKNILSRCFQAWCELRIESIRSMQVAEDFYDLLLANNTFVHWHRYVCVQIMLEEKKMKVAEKHHNRRLLFHSFYQWRSLPAVIQLEKSKEMKMKKWREKVWEILPDYKPPSDDSF